MDKLSAKNRLLIGITLFSMFFGAGNLIFPPFLGARAGTNTWIAFLGFAISAIGLPILGVIAIAKSGGLKTLAGRVHPAFAAVFTFLIYLSIGPCLAIPRTASTSFEMAVLPFLKQGTSLWAVQLGYSVLFFALAMSLALRPDKLTDRLGKVLSPILLVCIAVIFIGCIVGPYRSYSQPVGAYISSAATQGFLDGYLTMDAIAALNFGIIISMNIRALGVKNEKAVVAETVKAGGIASVLFVVVYGALTHIGSVSGQAFGIAENGAQTLTQLVVSLFGTTGIVILAIIFLIACLNTCVGLLCCCSEYFNSILPKISYKQWVLFFAFISMIVSNAGLNKILAISVPVLDFLYPITIVIIALAFLHPYIGQWKMVYPVCVLFTGAVGLVFALDSNKIVLPVITRLFQKIPFYFLGLGWILPALVGIALGIVFSKKQTRK